MGVRPTVQWNLLSLKAGVSVGFHRPELEENIQSQAEHQTEEGEGGELSSVAAGKGTITNPDCSVLAAVHLMMHPGLSASSVLPIKLLRMMRMLKTTITVEIFP